MIGIIIAITVVLVGLWVSSWYTIVRPSEAHLVVSPFGGRMVCVADTKLASAMKADKTADKISTWYLAVPEWLPFVGRQIRILDLTIKELLITQETRENKQARYHVSSSTKYRIKDVGTAAETFNTDRELQEQLKEVVSAGVRTVTIKHDLPYAISNKNEIELAIKDEIDDNLEQYGVELKNFQLIDFKDTPESHIVSDIAKIREIEIAANAFAKLLDNIKENLPKKKI